MTKQVSSNHSGVVSWCFDTNNSWLNLIRLTKFSSPQCLYLAISIGCLVLGSALYLLKHSSSDPAHFVYRHVPDGLWAASFIAAISFIWIGQTKPRYFWCIISLATMIAFEAFQFTGLINGTGEPVDAAVYVLFSLPILALNPNKQTNEKNKQTNEKDL